MWSRIVAIVLVCLSIAYAKEATMRIYSPAFDLGGMIPVRYTCDGEDISLPLEIEGLPAGTKSVAIVMEDPDAPVGLFTHWLIYDIPPTIAELPEGIPPAPNLSQGIKQGRNDFGNIGYGGPCPPGGTHRYFIKAYALDTYLDAPAGLDRAELLRLIAPHVIGEAEYMGVYAR